jgi:protoporphyrin/coproporphyrin ferrochelatase
VRRAVVLANLGGPDSLDAVRPFLFNLFNDAAILDMPQPLRVLLASLIAGRRAKQAVKIYARMGGSSPILPQTTAQAVALEALLKDRAPGEEIRVFTAMRYWHPFAREAAQAVKAWKAEEILLLPLYPQFSTTTTGSFFKAWDEAAAGIGLSIPTVQLCCYPTEPSFLAAHIDLIRKEIAKIPQARPFRLLFSAHGLPKRVIAKGDPYQWQIEETARAIAGALKDELLDWRICYQSRVGPLAWLEPATEAEIRRAGEDGKALIVVPIAFVSEHSETLVELDLDYAALAAQSGIDLYLRVPALGQNLAFIAGLADLVLAMGRRGGLSSASGRRLCPSACQACPHP